MGSTRRQFFSKIGAGAATVALQPWMARYASGAQPQARNDVVRINYNENPYGPSERALKAIRDAAASVTGRYFEDTYYDDLSNALAKHHGLKRDNIQVGAGSTEILKICDDVFLREKAKVVVAEPAYEAVLQYAANSRATAIKVPLTRDYRHDLVKMAEAVTADTGMVYICNPNNPTGTIVTKDEMQRFMARIPASVTVVVDEAYMHYVLDPQFESAVRYVQEGRNMIVARTFSKIHGLAGMRIGYAIAKADLIAKIKPHTVDYTITGMSAAAAMASVADSQNVQRVAKLNAAQRQLLFDEMKKANFQVTASHASFAMIDLKRPVAPIITEFEKRKVLVGREFPSMPNFMRVTIGTEDEMKKFLAAFRAILRA